MEGGGVDEGWEELMGEGGGVCYGGRRVLWSGVGWGWEGVMGVGGGDGGGRG